jgi:flagellar motor switch protein FliM
MYADADVREAELEMDVQSSATGERIEAYDLTSKKAAIRGGVPGLDIVGERFAASFRRTLSSALRQTCEIHAVSTEAIKFADFILQVPRPTGLFVFQMYPLPGGSAVVIDGQLLMALVDSMCGGIEGDLKGHPKNLDRDLTHLELRLLTRLAAPMAEDLEHAWRPLASVRPEFSQIVVRPELSRLAEDPESVLFSVFEIQMGDFRSPMGIILPMPTIEPIKERLVNVSHVPVHIRGAAGGPQMVDHLSEVDVDLSVELGRSSIDVRRLMSLAVGDILRLDTSAESSLLATVEGEAKFLGQPEAAGSSLTFKIEQRLDEKRSS